MFFIARHAAATFAGRAGRTSTTSTRRASMRRECSIRPRRLRPAATRGAYNPFEVALVRGPSTRRWLRPVPASWARAGSAVGTRSPGSCRWACSSTAPTCRPSSLNLAADLARYGGAAQWKRRLLPRRQDRVRGRRDRPAAGRLRAARGRAPADGAARRDHGRARAHARPRGPRVHAALLRVPPRPRHRCGRGQRRGRRDAPGRSRSRRRPGAAPSRASWRRRRPCSAQRAPPPGRGRTARRARTTSCRCSTRPPCATRPSWWTCRRARSCAPPAGPCPRSACARSSAASRRSPGSRTRGEVVKEESPLGLVVVRETRERAVDAGRARPTSARDMLEAAAVVPEPGDAHRRPGRGRAAAAAPRRTRKAWTRRTCTAPARRSRATCSRSATCREHAPVRSIREAARFLAPEPFIESDAPEIVAEARKATAGASGPRARAERLVRHVNELLEKKPTVSLPSALEVLRTRVGDCNEHTALFVALARARRACRPASRSGSSTCAAASTITPGPRSTWRSAVARCGCRSIRPSTSSRPTPRTCASRAAASTARRSCCRSIGRLKMTVHGRRARAGLRAGARRRPGPDADARRRRASPPPPVAAATAGPTPGSRPMIRVEGLVKQYGSFTAVDGVDLDVRAGRDPRLPGPERRRQDDDHPHRRRACCKPTAGRVTIAGHDLAREPEAAKAVARLHSRPSVRVREADRGRVPALPRRPLRPGGSGARRARRGPCWRCSSSRAGRAS